MFLDAENCANYFSRERDLGIIFSQSSRNYIGFNLLEKQISQSSYHFVTSAISENRHRNYTSSSISWIYKGAIQFSSIS